jgi:hypothetical protein
MLVRLLYASRAKKAPTGEDIEGIVAQARAHNAGLGLTGVLCWAGDVFLQVIEGGRQPVNQVYRQIAADPRHTDVILLAYEQIAERRFAPWTMGQVNLAKVNPSLLLKYCEKPALDPASISAESAFALLNELVATAAIVGRAG